MKAFSGILSGAYASWAYAKSLCCMPLSNNNTEKARHHGNEKSFVVIQDEPSLVPPPSMGPSRALREGATQERAPRKRRHGSGWSSFSVRSRLLPSASSSSRRPLISGPYNFRHLHSESFRFPEEEPQTRPRPSSFRPLELDILAHDNQLSPILPHFDNPSPPVTPPPRAYFHSSPSDGSYTISHQRSNSSMSFHIPRRPVAGGSVFDSPRSDVDTPQRPQPARMRAHTSPETPSTIMEDLVERVANAMMERDRLQDQIDDVIERQSIYASSRPSTAHGQPEMEPMPDIPALPPDAPSFSERLSTDRPRTAPSKTPTRVTYQANSSRKVESRVPPPPLPLRLRPPLRKKKSFSRVSTWLFPGGEHQRDISLDSITNLPKPVTGAEGFYQVAQLSPSRRSSLDTVSPVSEWGTEEKAVPTSWSPGSDKTIKAIIAETPITPVLGRRGQVSRPPRRSVGVAF